MRAASDQPSETMWWTTRETTCSRSPTRRTCAWNGASRVEVEAPGGQAGQAVVDPVGPARLDPQERRAGREEPLVGAVPVEGEDGAERLVALDEVAEGPPQGVVVELAPEADGRGDVVGRAGSLLPVESPQPPLDRRQRQSLRAGPGPERRAGGAGGRQPGGEAGHGRSVEQVAQGNLAPEGRPDPGHQPGGQQRVAAEGEEVVVDADPLEPEDLGEQRGQRLLVGRDRLPGREPARRNRAPARHPGRSCCSADREGVEHERWPPAPCTPEAALRGRHEGPDRAGGSRGAEPRLGGPTR